MTRFSKQIYIYDSLYGICYLPEFVWYVIPSAELQRLREVRLCNINSFCLTGGANINRYEHAVGTCNLARECLESWPLLNPVSEQERKRFFLAALLHDIASAAFGHSVEYVESQTGFDHEEAFLHIVMGQAGGPYPYKSTTLEPIFFGMPRSISTKIPLKDLKAIGETVAGKGRFGPLINSTMDLDNIDNVFRLAYHIGIVRSGETPLRLAKSLWTEGGELVLKTESIPLVEEWHRVRKRLYQFLLLNPQEFSAKCMLTEAIEIAKSKEVHAFNWYDVDFELFQELSSVSSETSSIVSRLMRGDLYGSIGIFSTKNTKIQGVLLDQEQRIRLEEKLSSMIRSKFSSRFKSAMIALHVIIDINKTERQVQIRTDDGETVCIGNRSNQLLVGAFFKNAGLSMYDLSNIPEDTINNVRQEVMAVLGDVLSDRELKEVKLYGETAEYQ